MGAGLAVKLHAGTVTGTVAQTGPTPANLRRYALTRCSKALLDQGVTTSNRILTR